MADRVQCVPTELDVGISAIDMNKISLRSASVLLLSEAEMTICILSILTACLDVVA